MHILGNQQGRPIWLDGKDFQRERDILLVFSTYALARDYVATFQTIAGLPVSLVQIANASTDWVRDYCERRGLDYVLDHPGRQEPIPRPRLTEQQERARGELARRLAEGESVPLSLFW